MPQVALVSDTHIPGRADRIPDWVADRVRAADHTVHAGDFETADAYETVAGLAGEAFTAVAGNVDPPELGLPDVATTTVGGVTVVVTHGTGSLDGYRERVAGVVRDHADGPMLGVSGHTHEVLDADLGDGIRLVNPGSATGAAPAEDATMLVVEATDGEADVTAYREGEPVPLPDA